MQATETITAEGPGWAFVRDAAGQDFVSRRPEVTASDDALAAYFTEWYLRWPEEEDMEAVADDLWERIEGDLALSRRIDGVYAARDRRGPKR